MKTGLAYFLSSIWLGNMLYLWSIRLPGRSDFIDGQMAIGAAIAFSLPFWAQWSQKRGWWGFLCMLTLALSLLSLGFQNQRLAQAFSFPLLRALLNPEKENPELALSLLVNSKDDIYFAPVSLNFTAHNLVLPENLDAQKQAEVQAWRKTKAPQHLRAAGYDLLIFPETWLGHSSEAEYETINNPAFYQFVTDYHYQGKRYLIYAIH